MTVKNQTEIHLTKTILVGGNIRPAGAEVSVTAIQAKDLVALGYAQYLPGDSKAPKLAPSKATLAAKKTVIENPKEVTEKEQKQEQTDDANNSADAEAPPALGAGRKGRGRRTSAAAASGD